MVPTRLVDFTGKLSQALMFSFNTEHSQHAFHNEALNPLSVIVQTQSIVQGSTKWLWPGLLNFVLDVAYYSGFERGMGNAA